MTKLLFSSNFTNQMSGNENEVENNDNGTAPVGSGTTPGTAGTPAPVGCTTGFAPVPMVLTGTVPREMAAVTSWPTAGWPIAYADLITKIPAAQAWACPRGCPPPCSCILLPVEIPIYYITVTNVTVLGISVPVWRWNVAQKFQPFCY